MEPIHIIQHLDNQYRELLCQNQEFHNKLHNHRVAVIVEPRRHHMLAKVIRNFMYHLGENWNLHIFTSIPNVEWIKKQLKGSSYRITPIDKDNLTTAEYSTLLMDVSFWEMIPEENILIFQTDCILFRQGIDTWIDEKEYNFDYVGANYYNTDHILPDIGGVQGGLSLRKKSAMIECIKCVTVPDVNIYREHLKLKPIGDVVMAEDVFFTHACAILKKRIPTIEKRREFSIEADYYPDTLGHHGLKCSYLTAEQQKELLTNA
jgi:hypothetical protein